VLHVKLPPCTIRSLSRRLYLHKLTQLAPHIIAPHYVVSVHWNASRKPLTLLKNTGGSRKINTTTEFLFTTFMSQNVKIISIHLLCPILHCSTWPADFFTSADCFIFPCFILFYFTFQFLVRSDTLGCPQ